MAKTEQVWEEFSSPLRAFIRRRVHDEHTADDLLQEVFVKIHNGLDSLKQEERLAGWLYRLARNVIVDHHRQRHVGELDGSAEAAVDADMQENLNELVSGWLSDLVGELPDTYRAAVSLSELQGVPQTEIAPRLGLSLSGAKSRVQRGRQMLRDSLWRCCHFELDRRGNVIGYKVKGCSDCCDSDNEQCES